MKQIFLGHLLDVAAKGYPYLFCVLCYTWMLFIHIMQFTKRGLLFCYVIRLADMAGKSLASSLKVWIWFGGHLAKYFNRKYLTSHSRPCSRPCQNVDLTLILFAPWIRLGQEAVTDAGRGWGGERETIRSERSRSHPCKQWSGWTQFVQTRNHKNPPRERHFCAAAAIMRQLLENAKVVSSYKRQEARPDSGSLRVLITIRLLWIMPPWSRLENWTQQLERFGIALSPS